MATLAAFPLHPWTFAGNLNARVLRELEVLHFLLMTRSTRGHPHLLGPGNHRGGQDHAVDSRTGDGNDRRRHATDQAGENFRPQEPSLWLALVHRVQGFVHVARPAYLRSAFGKSA